MLDAFNRLGTGIMERIALVPPVVVGVTVVAVFLIAFLFVTSVAIRAFRKEVTQGTPERHVVQTWCIDAAASNRPIEVAQLLLDAYKFRQAHCWRILHIYGLASVTVSIAPYVMPRLITGLGEKLLVFPVAGWMLALFGGWLFAAEYIRCRPFDVALRELLFREQSLRAHLFVEWRTVPLLLQPKIGWVTVAVLTVGFTCITFFNVLFLQDLLRDYANLQASERP